jgi:hypothetical protein
LQRLGVTPAKAQGFGPQPKQRGVIRLLIEQLINFGQGLGSVAAINLSEQRLKAPILNCHKSRFQKKIAGSRRRHPTMSM